MSKKINSEKQRLLTIRWVLQKQKTHKNDYFLLNTQLTWRQIFRNFQAPVRLCWIPVMNFIIKFSFANLHMLATPPSNYCMYQYSLLLILAQDALQFLFLFLPYVVAEYCHRVVHHAYLTEGFCNSCDSSVIPFSSFT